jgi:hypothetical protein
MAKEDEYFAKVGICNFSLHLCNSAILQTTKSIAELRTKKVAELRLQTFKIWIPQLSAVSSQFPLLYSPFSSAQDALKINPKQFLQSSVSIKTKNLRLRDSSVPDRRRRIIPEVVLVRRWVIGVLGIWRGRVWGRVGTEEVSLQATWDRGGRILSQLGGLQVSRRGLERGTKGNQQGETRSKGNAPCIL